MSDEFDYNGAVGIVHFSDESINDPNCLCFATKDKTIEYDTWSNLKHGNIFNYKSRIVQLNQDLSKLKKISFCFSSCSSLKKLFIHGEDWKGIEKPEGWEEQNFAKFIGSFDELIFSSCGFRNITNVTNIELKFPELIRCGGDFYNCKSLVTFDSNFSKCLIAEQEFDLCVKLNEVTFEGGLNKLMYAPGMFANCTSLTKFNYKLPVLLSGKRMFYNCKLNTASVKTILGSLPEIKLCRSTNNTVADAALKKVLTDAGFKAQWNEEMSENEPTKLADILKEQNDYWWYYNDDKTGLKHIRRDKSTNYDRIIIYYKYPKYDYKTNEIVDTYASLAISLDDFGVLDLGVDDNVENNSDVCDALNKAIANGWNISFNKTTKKYTYYKSGRISIIKRAALGIHTRMYQGTYIVRGERTKGKSGKLSILITPQEGYTGKYENEVVIEPANSSNDDGSFKQVKLISINHYGDINAKYSDFKLSLIPDEHGDFNINL